MPLDAVVTWGGAEVGLLPALPTICNPAGKLNFLKYINSKVLRYCLCETFLFSAAHIFQLASIPKHFWHCGGVEKSLIYLDQSCVNIFYINDLEEKRLT